MFPNLTFLHAHVARPAMMHKLYSLDVTKDKLLRIGLILKHYCFA